MPVAFTGSYSDLGNKPTIPSGAAANYPVANNDVTNNAGYLVTAQVAYQHGQEIDQLSSDLTARLPGGTGISWDGANFWGTTTGGVKKNWVTLKNIPIPDANKDLQQRSQIWWIVQHPAVWWSTLQTCRIIPLLLLAI